MEEQEEPIQMEGKDGGTAPLPDGVTGGTETGGPGRWNDSGSRRRCAMFVLHFSHSILLRNAGTPDGVHRAAMEG